jgi:hypothetical protein
MNWKRSGSVQRDGGNLSLQCNDAMEIRNYCAILVLSYHRWTTSYVQSKYYAAAATS